MGVFSNIKDKLFGKTATKPVVTEPTASTVPNATIETMNNEFAAAEVQAPEPVLELVDVEAILEDAVKAKGVKLNWRVSIVDLLKALDLDSSLAARKELAAELNYTGTAADGSAEKNIWLHKAVMKALAENGGKVPQELLS